MKRKLVSLALALIAVSFVVATTNSVVANEQTEQLSKTQSQVVSSQYKYHNYMQDFGQKNYATQSVSRQGTDYATTTGGNFEKLANGTLSWKDYGGSVTYQFNVTEAGQYRLSLDYAPLESINDYIELSLMIDDTVPFVEANTVLLEKPAKYSDVKKFDSRGNSMRAETELSMDFIHREIRDKSGQYNDPYEIYFTAGSHTVTFTAKRSDLLISKIELLPKKIIPTYAELTAEYTAKGYTLANDSITVQAEDVLLASNSFLGPQYNRTDANVEPSNPGKMVFNTAGGYDWQTDGQWMQWECNVKESGLYDLSFKTKQDYKSGMEVTRRLYIDDQIPCQEAAIMSFNFATKWGYVTPNKTEPFRVYLEKGTHTIRLEVVPGEIAESSRKLQAILLDLNDIYRQVVMITGVSPDANRDYQVDKEIPGLMDKITDCIKVLDDQANYLASAGGQGRSGTLEIDKLLLQMRSFVKKPETIPSRINGYKGNVDGLGAWINNLSWQPLDIDYFSFVGTNSKLPSANANFFKNVFFRVSVLVSSFFNDGTEETKKDGVRRDLTVWVALGRDQLQVVKQLADDSFNSKLGTNVNFNLVVQGITEAILAGSGPDVVLYAPSSDPVNLAMRGALAPLDTMNGFTETKNSDYFPPAFTPYEFNNHYYAMPLTQVYPMMFYRTDIFEELQIEPPKTWDDMYKIIPIIQRKNMNIGLPSTDATFANLLYQKGGTYYNENRSQTAFDSTVAIDAFTQYTRLFKDYALPLSFDFYNRFRNGTMPLAIIDYTEYNRLAVAAPEIKGMWKMVNIPYTENPDGSINRSVLASTGEAGFILDSCKNKDAAWEFLQWFCSAEVQGDFGRKIEALVGPAGRYPTANKNSLAKLPWLRNETEMLMEQWPYVIENPQIPGTYYVQRDLANAFRRVLLDDSEWLPREALDFYNKDMNREIKRKRDEFGLK